MPRLRLFAAAREAAGTGSDEVPGATVGEVLDAACRRYGERFVEVVAVSRVWVDGEPAEPTDAVPAGAEVAVLPPVSGGADAPARGRAAATARGGAPAATARGGDTGRRTGGTKGRARAGTPPTGATARSSPDTSGSTAAVRTGPTPLVERLFEPVDASGPKAALALAWVALQVLALVGGRWALAVLFGLVGAVAGLHTARTWRRQRVRANRAVAGLAPLAVPLAAAVGTASAGLVVLGAVVASGATAATARRRGVPVALVAGTTVRCWLGPAVAAASVVMVDRVATEAAASLLLLLAGYDLAAYVWGAGGGAGPLVGRVAGILTVGVLTFALSTVHLVLSLPPFQQTAAIWVFGGLAATLAPLGQLAASAMLPAAAAQAPALRRLDSLLLAGPAWAFALWGYTA